MKTKIIATIGPASEKDKIIAQISQAGAKRFRLNMSHGDVAWHVKMIKKLRKIPKVEIILDTKGPEIRTGKQEKPFYVKKEESVIITTNPKEKTKTKNQIFINYRELGRLLKKGEIIMIDSGKIVLKVVSIEDDKIFTKVKDPGIMSSFRHVNLPGKKINLPILTNSDKEILKQCKEFNIEKIAISFVRDVSDIKEVKMFLKENDINAKIISKIEHTEALKNIDKIIKESDEIMIARGDLGVETPWYAVPVEEELLIKKAHKFKKPIIVATQMLSSMVNDDIPSRADVMDISIAVQLGAQTVMLSDETASGKFPVEAVTAMATIVKYAEKHKIIM